MQSEPKLAPTGAHQASEQYFLLADISGYTAFLANVEQTHGLDFSHGIPAGYDILGALLDVDGVADMGADDELRPAYGIRTADRRDDLVGQLLGATGLQQLGLDDGEGDATQARGHSAAGHQPV